MEIRHFITFKKIVELGSFTRASENLGYAQSSVSSHIQMLESSIGKPLFNRIGKNLTLTNTGIELLKYVTELLNTYEKIENLKYSQDIPSGVIRIGIPETLMIYRLGPIFREYKKSFHQVDIILQNIPSDKLKENIHNGELDLAFFLDHEISDPELIVEKLIDEKMCLVFPTDFSVKNKNPISKNLTIFFTEKGCSYRYLFEQYLKNHEVYTENIMETWSIETIKKCVMNGIGMSFLPLITVIDEYKTNSLSILPLDLEQGNMVSQIAYHKNKWLSPALKKFIEITLKHSKEWKKPNI